LCGEKVYLPRKNGKVLPDASGAPRLALHAAELGFLHPVNSKPLRFQAPLPPELVNFWNHLKQKSATNERDSQRKIQRTQMNTDETDKRR
jgi:23S rRNA pseudouridine1911/1915/1917 synthase